MSIILSKNLKQKQSVKLTPSLKKSIDLLQLSRFELIKKIDKRKVPLMTNLFKAILKNKKLKIK